MVFLNNDVPMEDQYDTAGGRLLNETNKLEPTNEQSMGMIPKFVGKKVGKVRFKPVEHSKYKPEAFVTGSWDDEENCISVWRIDEESSDVASSGTLKDPKLLSICDFNGDVTELEYLDSTHLVAGSSNGDVVMFGHEGSGLFMKRKWQSLHTLKGSSCPVSGIATCNNRIVTVGEGARLTLLDPASSQPVYDVEEADLYGFTCVCYTGSETVLTGNMFGHVKQFDLRTEPKVPTTKLEVDNYQVSVMCLAKHPSVTHVVASGGEDGKISIWDLRSDKAALTKLVTHKLAVNEIKFHPRCANHMLSCSEDGYLCHWNARSRDLTFTMPHQTDSGGCNWLSESSRSFKVVNMTPMSHKAMNSLDVLDSYVICGSDNELVYIDNSMNVF